MKRFWEAAAVTEEPGGWGVRLDARPLNTPAAARVVVPARPVAEALAAEWEGVGETLDPRAMPVTRAVNVTIDRVAGARAEVAAAIAAYGEADLLCYRAPHPPELVARQAAAWDPLLDWAAEAHGARLLCAEGVMHVAQPPEALARLAAAVEALDPWRLTPMHELVTGSSSLVIGLAVAAGRVGAEEGWRASRIDEDWNLEQWGEDAEAAAQAARREADFLSAARLMALLESG